MNQCNASILTFFHNDVLTRQTISVTVNVDIHRRPQKNVSLFLNFI